MLKIDLHGFTYSKVKDILPNWLITNYNNGVDDFEIITGNSQQMKQVVKLICLENGFRAEDNWNGNSGSLLVTINRVWIYFINKAMLICYVNLKFFRINFKLILDTVFNIQDHQQSFGSGYNQTILTGPLHWLHQNVDDLSIIFLSSMFDQPQDCPPLNY